MTISNHYTQYYKKQSDHSVVNFKQLVDYLQGHPWMNMSHYPNQSAINAKGMLTWWERVMLSWIMKEYYIGLGAVVELGVFLGSSSISIASGLQNNSYIEDHQKIGKIYSYDRFYGDFEAKWIKEHTDLSVEADNRFYNHYINAITPWSSYFKITDGDLLEAKWSGENIEILFVDIMKTAELTDKVISEFFWRLIPGRSLLIMQDYLFHVLPYSVVIMEHFEEYFIRVGDTEKNSVLFLNTKQIPEKICKEFSWNDLRKDLKMHYLMSALTKQRTHLHKEYVAHLIKDFILGTHI